MLGQMTGTDLILKILLHWTLLLAPRWILPSTLHWTLRWTPHWILPSTPHWILRWTPLSIARACESGGFNCWTWWCWYKKYDCCNLYKTNGKEKPRRKTNDTAKGTGTLDSSNTQIFIDNLNFLIIFVDVRKLHILQPKYFSHHSNAFYDAAEGIMWMPILCKLT